MCRCWRTDVFASLRAASNSLTAPEQCTARLQHVSAWQHCNCNVHMPFMLRGRTLMACSWVVIGPHEWP